ncbi:MAG: Ig-like domain-containing protein, partial [Clostridia bacterium]
MGGYVFAQHPKPKNLVVTAKKVTPQTDAKATFRSNLTLETAQFTGDDITLNQQMFLGCSNLKQLDLSKVKTLAIRSGCFGDDKNKDFTGVPVNPFNANCNIYVDRAEKVETVRTGTGLEANSGIVLVVNGGTVEMGKTGFDSVTKKNHYAEWYEDSECKEKKVTTPTPEAGKTYYAKWVEKEAQELSFEKDAVTVHANEKTVTNPIKHTEGDGSVTYKSDKENVATVDATTGKVTIVGTGTATITATAAETPSYKKASAEYTLTVTDHQLGNKWESDADNHWRVCEICQTKVDSAAHEFQWVVDKEATTTEKGSKHEECKVCGYKKDAVEIPVIESGTTGGDQNNGNAGNGTKADTANGSKTGDTMPIGMLAVLMLAAAAGIV